MSGTETAGAADGPDRDRPPVRLSDGDLEGIRAAARRVLGGLPGARVWLHGSRTDLARRGGDIDLVVGCDAVPGEDLGALTRRLLLALEDRLGERRVDVVWAVRDRPDPFVDRVMPAAVELWRRSG